MNLEHRKYLRPNEVEEIYGIKVGTLAKQRNQGFGIALCNYWKEAKKKRKGGIILYDKEAIEEVLKTKGVVA